MLLRHTQDGGSLMTIEIIPKVSTILASVIRRSEYVNEKNRVTAVSQDDPDI